MNDHEIFKNMINDNLNEMGNTIDCLYTTSNSCVKNKLLNQLRKNITNITCWYRGYKTLQTRTVPNPMRADCLQQQSCQGIENQVISL